MPAQTDSNKVTSILHVCDGDPAQRKSFSDCAMRSSGGTRAAVRLESWNERSDGWRSLMFAGPGDSQAYERLLRELDTWLRHYYGRRVPFLRQKTPGKTPSLRSTPNFTLRSIETSRGKALRNCAT